MNDGYGRSRGPDPVNAGAGLFVALLIAIAVGFGAHKRAPRIARAAAVQN